MQVHYGDPGHFPRLLPEGGILRGDEISVRIRLVILFLFPVYHGSDAFSSGLRLFLVAAFVNGELKDLK